MPAVTLDLWHTLVYLPPEEEEGYMRHQIDLGTEILDRAPTAPGHPPRSRPELRRAFEQAYQEAVDQSTLGRTVTPRQQLERAAAAVGRLADPDEYIRGLESVVGRVRFLPAPGVLEFLDSLRAEGYRLAIVSNTVGEPGAYLRPALRSLGVLPRVETVVFSDEHPWTKPAPEIFRLALDRVGTAPSESVHVGDGWSDIEGARRAGYRAEILFTGLHEYGERYRELFLAKGQDRPTAEHRAERLEQVGRIVRSLLPVR